MIKHVSTVVAYLVATFATQALSHFVLNVEHYAAVTFMRAEPIFAFGVASMVIQGTILSYLYSRMEIGKDRSLNDHRGNTESKNRFGAHKSHGGIVFDVQDEVRQRLRSECCNQVRHHRRHVFYHDLSSFIRYSPLSGTRSLGWLPGQRRSKLHSPADPLEQRLLAPEAGRSNVDEAGERLARKIHLPGVGLRERFLVACRPDANHQVVIENAAAHPPPQQEREASEHLFLGDSLAPRYHSSDSIGQFFIVGQSSTS